LNEHVRNPIVPSSDCHPEPTAKDLCPGGGLFGTSTEFIRHSLTNDVQNFTRKNQARPLLIYLFFAICSVRGGELKLTLWAAVEAELP
jgi:hypothetical protein